MSGRCAGYASASSHIAARVAANDSSAWGRRRARCRARQKVRGSAVAPAADLVRHRRVVSAFLTAANGDVGAVVAPRGRLAITFTFTFTFEGEWITSYEVIADPARLRELEPRRPRLAPPEA
jgi:hypothetical protein